MDSIYSSSTHPNHEDPWATCGGATRIQLRASARRAVKVLIPRKMETPRLAMRMGADALGRADHEDFSMVDWKEMFISGNKRTISLFRETGVDELNLDREFQLAAINNPV